MPALRLVILTLLVSPLLLACADDGGGDQPKFTSGGGDQGDGGSGTAEESGGQEMGDGDGDPTTGDGDGDPTTGDGDGDPTTGDGDGDPTTGDGDGDPPGCDTMPGLVGASCGQDVALMGSVAFGESMSDLPTGGISAGDNGQGNGAEDWYRIDFPLDGANARPGAGTITLDFAINQGADYRFELYRDCGAQAFGQGLASEFGSEAPPLLEWTFGDLDDGLEQANYLETVPWPETVWVRVFRFQNADACSNYELQVTRN